MRSLPSLAISFIFLAGVTSLARGTMIITCTQTGSDVVCTVGGSVDLSALSLGYTGGSKGNVNPAAGVVAVGPPVFSDIDVYPGIPNVPFGPGAETLPSIGTGLAYGTGSTNLYVPAGYVSGATLPPSSSTYSGASLSSLGITPGTYVWNWGSGANADSAILTAIPEPSALCLLLLGLGVGGFARMRKKGQSRNHTNTIPT